MDIVERLRLRIHTSEDEAALTNEAADEIERLREALWDLEQYVSRADHFYLKPETLATLKEGE